MKALLTLCLLTFIYSCTSSKKPNVQESLFTEIKADGSKVFEFSVFKATSYKAAKSNRTYKNKRQAQQKTSAGRGRTHHRNERDELADYFEQRLNNLPIITLFCREHYFVLDKVNTKDEVILIAECNDSASNDDYLRFKSAVPSTP